MNTNKYPLTLGYATTTKGLYPLGELKSLRLVALCLFLF